MNKCIFDWYLKDYKCIVDYVQPIIKILEVCI